MTDQQPLKPMTPADWSALEKKLIAEHERTLQMNQEIRQLALQGKYVPELDTHYYAIGDDGSLTGECIATGDRGYYLWKRSVGVIFFPDEQTRTEFLQVPLGKWKPKERDSYFWCNAGGSITNPLECINYHSDDYEWPEDTIHFPSAEQRSAFIAKRKGEEPEVFVPVLPTTVTEHDYSDRTPKPQTITICISDEAIERTAKIMDCEMGDIRTTVALLHLEYTLQNQA